MSIVMLHYDAIKLRNLGKIYLYGNTSIITNQIKLQGGISFSVKINLLLSNNHSINCMYSYYIGNQIFFIYNINII